MGYSTSLAVYHLRVRKHHQKAYEVLNHFDGKTDLLDVVAGVFSQIKDRSGLDESAQVAIRARKIEVDPAERRVFGIAESGQYGVEHDLRNVRSGKTVYRKKKLDADMLPFYFQFHFRLGADEGQMVLQRNGPLGIFTITREQLDSCFKEAHAAFKIDIDPVLPEEVIEERLRKGEVTKVRFVKFGRHPDLAEFYASADHRETTGRIELVVSTGRNRFFNFGKRLVHRWASAKERKLIEIKNFDYDTIKVEFELEGKRQVVDLDTTKLPRAYYLVDERVKKGSDGFPEFESIHQVASGLLADLAKRMYQRAP